MIDVDGQEMQSYYAGPLHQELQLAWQAKYNIRINLITQTSGL